MIRVIRTWHRYSRGRRKQLVIATRKQRAELAKQRVRYESLTQREREVMSLVVTGLLNKQIAAKLGTTEFTIKIHRRAVIQKMQAPSLADLVRTAQKLGLFSRDE